MPVSSDDALPVSMILTSSWIPCETLYHCEIGMYTKIEGMCMYLSYHSHPFHLNILDILDLTLNLSYGYGSILYILVSERYQCDY